MSEVWEKDSFLISCDKTKLQLDRIHHFLSQEAYWSLGIPRKTIETGIQNSLCFGVYEKATASELQIGFARVISDYASFAWLCDVYIESSHRGLGLSKWLMKCICNYPKLQNLRRFALGTRDAHGLYHQFGFEAVKNPENMLEIKNNDIYKRELK